MAGFWFFSMLGFLKAWWLGSKSKCSKRTRGSLAGIFITYPWKSLLLLVRQSLMSTQVQREGGDMETTSL